MAPCSRCGAKSPTASAYAARPTAAEQLAVSVPADCHDTSRPQGGRALLATGEGDPLVALVGPPNSGKTTLFNQLTGLRQKVGNYPGVTVEKHVGRVQLADGRRIDLLDLPG